MSIDYELKKLFLEYNISDSDIDALVLRITEIFGFDNQYQSPVPIDLSDYVHKDDIQELVDKLDRDQENDFVSNVEYVIEDIKELIYDK